MLISYRALKILALSLFSFPPPAFRGSELRRPSDRPPPFFSVNDSSALKLRYCVHAHRETSSATPIAAPSSTPSTMLAATLSPTPPAMSIALPIATSFTTPFAISIAAPSATPSAALSAPPANCWTNRYADRYANRYVARYPICYAIPCVSQVRIHGPCTWLSDTISVRPRTSRLFRFDTECDNDTS